MWLENAGLQWGVSAGIAATTRPNGLSDGRGKFLKITGLLLDWGAERLCSVEAKSPVSLLDRVRDRIRLKHYSIRTEQAYCDWIRRFIIFHDKRHPSGLGAADVAAFATHLLESGYAIQSVQELLGHSDVRTTMVCAHVLNRGGRAVVSPLDG